MAIIYSYPQINLSSISADDLMIISDMNADGRPTKSLTLKNLADFVTSTGTGTGTTNAIIKWSDGPAGLLGDSIMNEDTDKINLNGILRIADNNDNRLEVKYGTDSSTTHLNNAPANNHIIGRAGDLIIKNRARTRDIVFQADNGEYNGTVDTYFRLDGSMADISNSDYYTRWGNNSHIVLGPAQSTLAFDMYYDGSDTYLINGSNFLYVESKGGISIENKSGGSGDIDIIQSVTNADINISAYNGTYFKADTSAGATIFSKPVEVPLVPAANANAASKQYVDQQIASIPAGLVFQGNWDANANSPTLASGTGTVGNYYVVSVAGNTNLDGITDWEVGDWAVFVEVGGVDKWDKIDQTFVQGAGATGQVSFWNGINSVTGDNDLYWDNTNKKLGVGTTTPETRVTIKGDALNTNQPNRITNVATDTHTALFINGTGASVGEKYGIQFGGYNQYSIGGIFGVMDSIAGSTSGDITFDFGNGTAAGALIEKVRFTHEGNVGIGTTAPAHKLDINQGAIFLDSDWPLYLGSTNASIEGNSSGTIVRINASAGFKVTDGGDTRLLIDTDGKVGIGTVNPTHLLNLSKSDSNSVQLVIDNTNTTDAGTETSEIRFRHYRSYVPGQNDAGGIIVGKEQAWNAAGDRNSYMAFGTRTGSAGVTEKMRITSTGNVGIGTITPAAKLDVIGRIGLNDGNDNVSVGDNAGAAITTGVKNILIGAFAGDAITTGTRNIAIGYAALSSEDGHSANIAIGHSALSVLNAGSDAYNVAVGHEAGKSVTTGIQNTLIGGLTGDALTTGGLNVAVGYGALSVEQAGGRNVAIGWKALVDQNVGSDAYNVAVGYQAGLSVTTGINNTIIGGLAGDALTTGGENVAIGRSALSTEIAGSRNVAIGYEALKDLNTSSAAYNIAIGYHAGTNVTTGVHNVLLGGLAGDALTTGSRNTVLGYSALSTEDTGGKAVAIGWKALLNQNFNGDSYNVAIGYEAGQGITTGLRNTLIGGLAGDALTTGQRNVAIGYGALSAEDEHGFNTAIGHNALAVLNAGQEGYNTAVGYDAGQAMTTAINNTLIGGLAGDALTTGSDNVAIGSGALTGQQSGNSNVAIGRNAMVQGTATDRNVAVGYFALNNLNFGGDAYNVAVGFNAGLSVTTGIENTLIGGLAGEDLTTGDNNVALGYRALRSETIGNGSVAIGAFALEDQQSGAGAIILNTAVGYEAGKNIDGGPGNGDQNTAIGGKALDNETTGQENTAVGVDALGGQNGADNNTALGWRAGYTTTTGSNVTLIGYNALASTGTVSNEITLGDTNVTALRCAVTSITSLSDERDKSDIKDLTYGLELIDSLKPKEFVWDNRAEIDDEGNEFYSANKGKKDFGFIAQEVKELDNDTLRLIYDENPERLEMSYGKLVPILVKAIQELSAKVKILENK